MNKIISYLDELIPNPQCELYYQKDYELLIAITLSAQTKDSRVNVVLKPIFEEYPTLDSLNSIPLANLEERIKSLGNYHKKALYVQNICAKVIANNYYIPNDRAFLESIKGVGRKTTNLFLAMIYHEPYIAVDTHVARVSKRLGIVPRQSSLIDIEEALIRQIPKDKLLTFHHQLVLFGRYYCKSISPQCKQCQLQDICKRKSN